MLAVVLEKPGRLALADTEKPAKPGPGEALLRVRQVGLCGTDIHAYRGRQPFFEYPRVLGHELGVEIEAVGSGVSHLRPGDRCSVEPYLSAPGDVAYERGRTNCSASTVCLGVHVDGGMRERIVAPADKLHPSAALPFEQLALVETLCIGHHAVERAALLGDELVAVVGLGPIGLATLQFALLQGVKAVAADVSEERLDQAAALAPGLRTLRVDPQTPPAENWKALGLPAPEVVWDCTGSQASMQASIGLADFGGRVVFVGIHNGEIAFDAPFFHRRELSLLSSRNATKRNFRSVIQLLENGQIDVAPWITHRCEAAEFPARLPEWLGPGSGLLKGVIAF